jgi:S-(hydroxymethyl)glutathione dehydrogenase/alcohol dehydrogenase
LYSDFGGIGLNVIQGLRLAGADMIIGVDINNGKKEWGERFGMTHFVNPKEVGSDLVAHLVNDKAGADQIGGADYTFDCTGNVAVMRQALEACHRGWGQAIIIGVAPGRCGNATRPFQLVTGRVWRGRPSAAPVVAPTCRKSSTGTWKARSRLTR